MFFSKRWIAGPKGQKKYPGSTNITLVIIRHILIGQLGSQGKKIGPIADLTSSSRSSN
jgi:hypothetical protein